MRFQWHRVSIPKCLNQKMWSHQIRIWFLKLIPLTLDVDFIVRLLATEVSPFHVIFDLNEVMITTCFDKGFCIIIPILDWRNSWRNVLHNSKSIFGL
jgi:hypothetical protein